MGSSPLLRTNNITIDLDPDGRIVLRFSPKESDFSEQETLNEIYEELDEQVILRTDSMDSYNARGCDEIMCQFIKDLDKSYKFPTFDSEVAKEI